jgi:hypothetical protein
MCARAIFLELSNSLPEKFIGAQTVGPRAMTPEERRADDAVRDGARKKFFGI